MARVDIAKTSGAVSVATSDTAVVAANISRSELTIVNDSANIVYLQLQTAVGATNAAVANQGIRLNASGGSWTTNSYTGAVRAIALTGASVVTVMEL